jgi:DsbC/DsbD-like thiol-disulfide interchange protein
MMKTAWIAGLALSLIAAAGLEGQDTDHVLEAKSLIARDAVRPGEVFKAALVVKVRPGWHVNDNAPLDEFMIPTDLVISGDPDFEVVEIAYPKGRRARFAYSEAELVVYEGEVVLGVLLKAKEGLSDGPRSLRGALTYQACNDESCLPPRELAVEMTIPVCSAGGTADIHPEVFGKLRFQALQK